MINKLKRFYETNFAPINTSTAGVDEHKVKIALAALIIEVAESDYKDAPEERAILLNIVKDSFGLSVDESNELLLQARIAHQDSTDYFQFTRLINDNYSSAQKIKLIENLWQVAFSDNHLDKYEEHVIRRISDLIYVSHSDFIETKLKVKQRQKV